MAHGLPIVTTSGALTESIWASQDALELVSVGDSDAFAARTAALIANPERRAVLGTRAAAMYDAHLSAGRAVELLTRQPGHPHA